MSKLRLTLLTKYYDYLAPLACGDVSANSLDLQYYRDTSDIFGALDRTLADPTIEAGELSFSRHLLRIAQGDYSFVAIPFFAVRGFRHRCFFVSRGSNLRSLTDLAGRRVGTNEWPATGNTWSRAAIHERGVPINQIQWFVGSVDGIPSSRPQGALPAYAQSVSQNQTLKDLLLKGELDALMCPEPPNVFYQRNSPIVRLFEDYRTAEQDYYRRTKVYPAHHVIGVRRETFQRSPWVLQSLYQALEEAKKSWLANLRQITDMLPWLAMEETQAVLGQDWNPSGVDPNRIMVQTLCDELLAQDLVDRPIDPATVFLDFTQTTKA